ncbi:MAG: P-loop NTPase [Saccharofermentanales bacterium]|jgi:hypothetical protein
MHLPDKKITIVAGHYGTGKTEFAVNLAIAMAREGRKTALVDLDIVNPYFRSYERQKEMAREGIKVFVTSNDGKADIPSLPADIQSIFIKDGLQSIIDLGGDPVGARVLGYYKPQLDRTDRDFLFVINQNRPENATVEQAIQYLQDTEFHARQRVTGIVNNTHLCRETTVEDILRGDRFAAEVADRLDLPLVYTVGERRFAETVQGRLNGPYFPIDLYMIKPWELSEDKGGQFAWLVE